MADDNGQVSWTARRGDYNPGHGGMVAEVYVKDPLDVQLGRKFIGYRRVGISAHEVHHKGQDPAWYEGESNLALILAAPDMLAALRVAADHFGCLIRDDMLSGMLSGNGEDEDNRTIAIHEQMKAAIAKATSLGTVQASIPRTDD